ncbi:PREDICTED: transmembrane protein 131-like isoform X2 [Priapulus caudatus]|uniref:Transmembrane protein 131-like isoform X2 n=1 Tax=Priapulus caudatus TaxID=37621 RepID=A0ABM1FBH9_PRICU|nr:PREDICTED: transmembrane protein 131-like isoform X2 [Priapulus caudatus]
MRTSLVIIRNNLTVLDVVILEGQGGRGELKVAPTTIKFDIKEKDLQDCDKTLSHKITPMFPVQRKITLRNTGELPLYVNSVSVNEHHCEGYGFKVLNCAAFELLPNKTQHMTIAFTPDFTMSRVQRCLQFATSLGDPLNTTIIATLPAAMIAKCAGMLPRPPWEPILYYSLVSFMSVLLFCVLAASYFESDRLWTEHKRGKHQYLTAAALHAASNGKSYDPNKVLDLRAIGTKSLESKTSSKADGKDGKCQQNGGMSTVNSLLRSLKGDKGHKDGKNGGGGGGSGSAHDASVSPPVVPAAAEPPARKGRGKRRQNAAEREKAGDESKYTMENRVNQERAAKEGDRDKYNDSPQVVENFKEKAQKEKPESKQRGKAEKRLPRHLEESDTSSTTTECSSPDSEISDKVTTTRDLTPDNNNGHKTNNKKHKGKGRQGKVPTVGTTSIDDDFELMSSKAKMHRKAKSDSNKAFGSDITKPSTPDQSNKTDKNKECDFTTTRMPRKKSNHNNNKNSNEAFIDLATQTESFAQQRHGGGGGGRSQHSSHDPPGGAARSSSYSSVVSSGGDWQRGKGAVGDKLPGPIGTKSSTPKPLKLNKPSASVWEDNSSPLALPKSPPDFRNNSLFLPPIVEGSAPRYQNFGNDVSLGFSGGRGSELGYSLQWPLQESMMQRSLAERRQRLEKHFHQQGLKGEDWPGFNVTPVMPVRETLWDNNAQQSTFPTDRWTAPNSPATVWEPTPPATGAWSLGGDWMQGGEAGGAAARGHASMSSEAGGGKDETAQGSSFDPFSFAGLRSIWSNSGTNLQEVPSTSWASIFQNGGGKTN